MDSTVLLHQLIQLPALKEKIIALHINHGHGLLDERWEQHCRIVAEAFKVPLHIKHLSIKEKPNFEARARHARYEVFSALIAKNDYLLLAHHANDQAETFLLNLCRGAGVDGLCAMPNFRLIGQGFLLRPFLHLPKKILNDYAFHQSLKYIEDETNQDLRFSRNYIRLQILPLLENKWPGVVLNIQKAAAFSQEAQENLEDLANLDAEEYFSSAHLNPVHQDLIWTASIKLSGQSHLIKYQQRMNQEFVQNLALNPLKKLSKARIFNVLRTYFRRYKIPQPSSKILNHLFEDLILSRIDASGKLEWGPVIARRYRDHLYFSKEKIIFECCEEQEWCNFPKRIELKSGLGSLSIELLGDQEPVDIWCVSVKYRKGGEKILIHGQNKSLKNLMQVWGIPPWQRVRIPLLYINEDLAAVLGYAISDIWS